MRSTALTILFQDLVHHPIVLDLRHGFQPRFLSAVLLHILDRIFGQLLPEHPLSHLLLPGLPVADTDHDAAGDVAADTEAQDDGRETEGSGLVWYRPGTGTEGNLEDGMEVENSNDRHKQPQWEGEMCFCLVRLVEGVRLGELGLMVLQLSLLRFGEDRVVVWMA